MVLCMTRREERAEEGRKRAEAHQKRRRLYAWVLGVSAFLYVGVPVLWNGAVEFGLVQQIQNAEFKKSLSLLSAVLLFIIATSFGKLMPSAGNHEKKVEASPEAPASQE